MTVGAAHHADVDPPRIAAPLPIRCCDIAAQALTVAAPVLLLLRWGGRGAWTLHAVAVTCVLAAILAVISLGRRCRTPPLLWIPLLLGPPALITLIQLLPLGWAHPWAHADLAALGQAARTWALDAEAGWRSLLGQLSLMLWLTTAMLVWRRWSPRRLLDLAVLGLAAHAAAALALALIWPEFPHATAYVGRVRGTFTYPNHAAALWAAALPAAILWASHQGGRGGPWRWAAAVTLLLALVLSASRGGILLGLPTGAATLLLHRARWRRLGRSGLLLGAVAAGLLLIGIDQTLARFADMTGTQGLTLNGRILLWREGWPLALEAGPLGAGHGAVWWAWRRRGFEHFEPTAVDHLHQDPLELMLTQGWPMLLWVLLILAWILRQLLQRGWPMMAPARAGLLAALLLAAYSCGDLILQSPALRWLALGGLGLTTLSCWRRRRTPAVQSSLLRSLLLSAALLLALLILHDLPLERERAHSWTIEQLTQNRQTELSDPVIAAFLNEAQHSARANALQARLALDRAAGRENPERSALLAQAEAALDRCARLHPTRSDAWVERLRLALARNDREGLRPSLQAVERWTPAWPYAQPWRLRAARMLGDDEAERLARRVLTQNLSLPPNGAKDLAAILGTELLAELSPDTAPRLRRSLLPWLQAHASLEQWRRTRASLAPTDWVVPPQALPAALLLRPNPPPVIDLPQDRRRLRNLAERLQYLQLPLPKQLEERLQQLGPPWSLVLVADQVAASDPTVWSERATVLDDWPLDPWCRTRSLRWRARLAALAGDRRALEGLDAEGLALVADQAGEDGVGALARSLLRTRHSRPRWLEDGPVLSSRIWRQGDDPPLIVSPQRWTLLLVDARPARWIRGPSLVLARGDEGLRHVRLIQAP